MNEGGTHAVVMFYTFSSTIMMAFAIRNVRSLYRERKQLKKSLEFAEKQQTLDKLKLLDTGSGVPRDTFILAVLEQLGVLDRDTDIQPWIEVCQSFKFVSCDYDVPVRTKTFFNVVDHACEVLRMTATSPFVSNIFAEIC